MIHFHSRSLYANFENIKYFLNQVEQVIDFEMNGYDLVYVNSKNKNSGGGVTLFVDRKFN